MAGEMDWLTDLPGQVGNAFNEVTGMAQGLVYGSNPEDDKRAAESAAGKEDAFLKGLGQGYAPDGSIYGGASTDAMMFMDPSVPPQPKREDFGSGPDAEVRYSMAMQAWMGQYGQQAAEANQRMQAAARGSDQGVINAGWRKRIQEGLDSYGKREAPMAQAAQMDTAQEQQWRDKQAAMAADLQARATGQAPSVAEMQMRQGLESGSKMAMGAALSQRGISPGMATRIAQQGIGDMSLDVNAAAAQARLSEMQNAQNTYAQFLGGARTQDINQAQYQAGMQQQTNQGNQQAQLQQTKQNDAMIQSFMQQGMTYDQAQQAAQMKLQELKAEQSNFANTLRANAYTQANTNAAKKAAESAAQRAAMGDKAIDAIAQAGMAGGGGGMPGGAGGAAASTPSPTAFVPGAFD